MDFNESSSNSSGGEVILNSPPQKAKKQCSPAIRYCFTFNNYTEDDYSSIVLIIREACRYGIIGREFGKQNGTPHLQGYIEFKKKARAKSVFKDWKSIHWEKAKGDRESNIKYCSKESDEIWEHGGKKPIKIISELRDWQNDIKEICLTEPDDRTIHWFWESEGNVGKSAFIKYMVVKHKALFCQGGKVGDIMNLVFNADMDECDIVLFDIPRVNKGHVSYASLENIKNGLVCNTKYETGFKAFNSPHVMIFANFEPDDTTVLSCDRWHVVEIGVEDINDNYFDSSCLST